MLPFVFELFKQSAGCLLWGIVIAAACVVLLFCLIRSWNKDVSMPGMTYVVLVVMFFMLAYHCVFIVGETKIIGLADDYKGYVASVIETCNFSADEYLSKEEADKVLDGLFDQYPILHEILRGYAYEGSVVDMPNAMIDSFVEHLKRMLVEDVLWCVGICAVGAVLVVLIMRKGGKRQTTVSMKAYTPSDDVF